MGGDKCPCMPEQHTMCTSYSQNVRVVSAFLSLVPNGGDGGDVVREGTLIAATLPL